MIRISSFKPDQPLSVVCPLAPLKIDHGYRIDNIQNQTVYHLGDEVEYQCERGDEYELNYTDPISCNNDGRWNPYIPSCNLGNNLYIPSCNLGNNLYISSCNLGNNLYIPSCNLGNNLYIPSCNLGNNLYISSCNLGNNLYIPSCYLGNNLYIPSCNLGNDLYILS